MVPGSNSRLVTALGSNPHKTTASSLAQHHPAMAPLRLPRYHQLTMPRSRPKFTSHKASSPRPATTELANNRPHPAMVLLPRHLHLTTTVPSRNRPTLTYHRRPPSNQLPSNRPAATELANNLASVLLLPSMRSQPTVTYHPLRHSSQQLPSQTTTAVLGNN